MDMPSKNKPAAGRYALLDELRGLDLLSMIGYHACWDRMSAMVYRLAGAPVARASAGFCCRLTPAAGGHRPLRRQADRGMPSKTNRPSAAAAGHGPGWWCRCCSSRQPTTHRMVSGSWARGRYCCRVFGMPTSLRRSSAFPRGAFLHRLLSAAALAVFVLGMAWGGPA